ncbi:DNA polymerase kappa [Homo sapiens]|uniref:Isoform 3 of DNA polymerase kappa n=1 Tax=Homo sapiens TaxID=9606 RepID=Q9UBT6-3|nr:DNA polymerase kappa [Homo sapiens]KAI2537948.1 DNA polymerase kappa [Homo sapiens]KAI4021730.1 DNA polymerase kappa [Homo sapiens]
MDSTKEKCDSYKDDLLLRMGLNDNKAGMEGLDKEKINKIIMEATKGSRFYGNELKKEKQVNQRIENMMQQKAQITSQQLRKAQLQVDRFAMELEQSRNLSNTIVHIDMDAFYAAVEMRDNPELKDKPIAVGSMSMLSTSNYHARRFGVRAAMPGFIAKRLCPQLIIVPPNFDKYRAVSKEVKEILADYDPNFMAMSLDEAYLNITKHLEERQNWPEDKRRYFIKMGSSVENDNPGKEVNKLSEHERSISPLLFEESPSDVQPPGDPFQVNFEEQNNPQILQNSVVFGTSAQEVVKEIRFRIEQKTTLTASAGVRISSFPNEEDRKHQQRSIIGFLQAGNQALSATECTLEKTDKDKFVKPLEMSHKKSFFDKKRSERKWSHQDTFKCEAVNKQSFQTSQPFQVLKKKMNENLEISENSDDCQILTCPVCFRAQGCISLEALNKHVDECLDGPSISENFKMFSCSHVSATKVNKKENVPASSLCEKQDYEAHPKIKEISSVDCIALVDTIDNSSKAESIDALSNKHSKEECSSLPSKSFNIEHCHQNSSSTVSLENEDVGSFRQEYRQPYLCEVKTGQALVCPVCNVEQKTSDLTLFNVHVDVCLNKSFIQELRKDKFNPVNQPKESSRSTGSSSGVQKAVTRTKRPGLMTKYSTSKKIKPNNPKHTLDIFFK